MSRTWWKITITADWQYIISWLVTFDSNSVWFREAFIRKNWSITLDITLDANQTWWAYTHISLNTILTLSNWDYLEVKRYQNSGWNLNVLSWVNKTFLKVIKIW
jgi:hypothetical protein